MKTTRLKVARVGNSRGVRLPAPVLRRYGIGETVVMEERADEIALRPSPKAPARLSWSETAEAMARSNEDWSEWECTAADGLDSIPWDDLDTGISEAAGEYRDGGRPQPRKPRAPPCRYDVCWARLDPVQGAEMGKRRPVVVVSLDVLNQRLLTVTVCPLTSQLHPGWRSRLPVQCAGRAAEVAVDQIRTLGRERLGEMIDRLTEADAASLRRMITELYGE